MKNEKILVTGSSGFIGTNLIETLLYENKTVIALDQAKPKIEKHIPIWKEIDITDYHQLNEIITSFNPTHVVHLAARTDLNGATIDDYAANTVGVENLLKILETLPHLEKVVFASSMYVCQPGYQPVDYEDYKPHTPYGESKVLTEKLIKKANPKYTWSIIRPTSIWGPFFGEPYNLFFKIVLSRKYFHMGKKACSKTYGYIDNTIYQILEILKADTEIVDKKVFYLGDYTPYDITEWADEIAEEARFKIPEIPFFVFKCGAWFGDLLKLFGIRFPMTSFRLKNMTTDNIHDTSLIQRIAPSLPVNRIEGIKKTIEWIKSN
jgi:nucleoside-diphosphate-sugar epimerase